MKNSQRILHFRMLVETFGQQDMCAQVHGSSPKSSKQLALYFYMLYVFGVLRLCNRWNDFINGQMDFIDFCRVKMNFYRCRINIAGCNVPVLAFATVHGQLYGLPGLQMKGFVFMQQHLHIIISGRHFFQPFYRVAKCVHIYQLRRAGLPVIYIYTKYHLRIGAIAYCKPGFFAICFRQQQQQAAIQCCGMQGICNRNSESLSMRKQAKGKQQKQDGISHSCRLRHKYK